MLQKFGERIIKEMTDIEFYLKIIHCLFRIVFYNYVELLNEDFFILITETSRRSRNVQTESFWYLSIYQSVCSVIIDKKPPD